MKPDIEAIRKRNEERRLAERGECGCGPSEAEEWSICRHIDPIEAVPDIDALLAEVERLNGEIDRLRRVTDAVDAIERLHGDGEAIEQRCSAAGTCQIGEVVGIIRRRATHPEEYPDMTPDNPYTYGVDTLTPEESDRIKARFDTKED